MSLRNIMYILIVFMLLGGCREMSAVKPIQMDKELSIIESRGIDALKNTKIFFGHASVGYNIIDGLENIRTSNDRFAEIMIRELKSGDGINTQGIYHSVNGENGFPKTKIDGFRNFLREGGNGNRLDIAFFKFCYVDFDRNSDIKEIFDYYSKSIDEVKKEFPNLKIMHVSTPLYAHAWGLKGFVKSFVSEDTANIKRNEFNRLLVNKYKDLDPIYDLAIIESTLQDNTRVSFERKGEIFFSLAKQYTDDGGHLNEFGKFYAAKELLNVLCDIAMNINTK